VPSGWLPPFDSPAVPPRRPRVWRLVLGCVLVIALSAAASVVVIRGEIGTLAGALSFHKAITLSSGSLAPAGFGAPQTILLIGNDQRKHTTTTPVLPHSNEMLLVRIDPSKPWISMMSIPRELQVALKTPNGPVTTRLNAALVYGGTPLLLSTIKQLTGLSINHVVEIDFNQFKTAINDIGCVYSTVDRRYYHVNTAYSEQYQAINLQPGYQKMCGTQALQFVSYRHGDTSLVRDARDQDFLVDVKKEYGPSLSDIGNIHRFERIFGRTVEVDRGLQTASGVENLLGTLISSASLRVRQVKFQANLQPIGANSCACDTATQQQIAASVHSFLYGADKVPQQSTAAAARAVHHHRVAAKLPLVAISTAGLRPPRASARRLPFSLEYPRVQDAGGSSVPVSLRNYLITGADGRRFPAYVAVFSAGLLGQYYDVQGMTWTGAPMFANPEQTVAVGGRTYSLYYSGQHLMVVAWHAHGAVYWVHNTLTDAVGNGELLAIAEQTLPTGTPGRPGSPIGGNAASGRTRLKAVVVPVPTGGTATGTSLPTTIGSIGGLVSLLAIPLVCLALVRRRRGLSELRGHLHATMQLTAQLSAATAHNAGMSPSAAGPSPATYTRYKSSVMRARRLPRPGLRTLGVVGVVTVPAAGLLLVLLTGVFDNTPQPASSSQPPPLSASRVPTVPVAVLNATSTPGAAAGLARQLRSQGVKIAAVGNLAASRRPGLWILYAPGARAQAARLARLLAARASTLAPIDRAARAAAGPATQIVAVIE
jgi:polyisoprenyl-teichoic acid--peptidoglycan teichoic acid transferase